MTLISASDIAAIDEISPGMTVRESELQDIVDTYVVLDNTEIINTDSGSDIVGTIWFVGSPSIIDTGSINTTISLRSFLPESDLVELKKKDIEQKVPYSFGYGINDTEEKLHHFGSRY